MEGCKEGRGGLGNEAGEVAEAASGGEGRRGRVRGDEARKGWRGEGAGEEEEERLRRGHI